VDARFLHLAIGQQSGEGFVVNVAGQEGDVIAAENLHLHIGVSRPVLRWMAVGVGTGLAASLLFKPAGKVVLIEESHLFADLLDLPFLAQKT